jgi:hypothetical protein
LYKYSRSSISVDSSNNNNNKDVDDERHDSPHE